MPNPRREASADERAIRKIVAAALCLIAQLSHAQVLLTADGRTDTYTLINSVLGGNAVETPDCSDSAFGPHLRQEFDGDLGRPTFVFYLHAARDNDRCTNFDRQRTEIKTYGPSSDYLKGFHGHTVSYRWKFKLDRMFLPTPDFTHIHQLKAGDGDADIPLITLTARAGRPEQLQLIHVDSRGTRRVLTTADLLPMKGKWVEAYERITYAANGSYALIVTRVDDGAKLLAYSNDKIDMWRAHTTFVRPKWGIYRSLKHPDRLRDEAVRFADFCLAKGNDSC